MKCSLLFFTIAVFAVGMSSAFAQEPNNKTYLIKAENDFAQLAVDSGFKNAFLQNLDSQGVVFNSSQPVNGLSFYGNLADKKDLLFKWYPVRAAIDAQGDMGFTTGPYILLSAKTNDTIAAGNYFSVWRKNHEGHFKVLLDGGVTHTSKLLAKEYGSLPMINEDSVLMLATSNNGSQNAAAADIAFRRLAAFDLATAYKKSKGSHCYLLRADHSSVIDLSPESNAADTMPVTACRFVNKGSFYSDDNSWFFSYGTADATVSNGDKQTGYFVHVWQYQTTGWKLIADVLQLK